MKRKQLHKLRETIQHVNNRWLFVMTILPFSLSINAQHVLTREYHAPQDGDELTIHEVEYSDAGMFGEHAIWDFSANIQTGEEFSKFYVTDGDSIFVEAMPSGKIVNTIRNDSIFTISEQENLYQYDFQIPAYNGKYPSAYGDSYHSSYRGGGSFSNAYAIDITGDVLFEADAYGTLILSEQDSLQNVLRLHIIRTSSVGMATDTLSHSDIVRKQKIEETYRWYARGYRYPVYETVSQSYYDNTVPVTCVQKAYLCLPEDQKFIVDSLNLSILREDSLQKAIHAPEDIINYSVYTGNGTVTLAYDLKSKATVRVLLTDAQGIIYRQENHSNESGSGYSVTFSTAGLRRGNYVIYINVNGRIYNEKFRKE